MISPARDRSFRQRLRYGTALVPVLFAGPAMAAPYNWAGFYVGLNGGGAWSSTHQTTTVPCTEPAGVSVAYFCDDTGFGAANGAAVASAYSGSFSGSGFSGGAGG